MPLFISKKEFNERSTIQDIKKAIKALPSPDIVPFNKNININPEEVVIYHQRETAKVLLPKGPKKTIKYFGSNGVLTCMSAHLQNGKNEFAGIHIDGSKGSAIALNDLIDSFISKENLEITLMGGLPGSTSEAHLELIIKTLLKRKEKITVSAQFIIEKNIFTDNARLLYVRDQLLEKARILFEKLYSDVEFDVNSYAGYKPSLFEIGNNEVVKDEIKEPLSLLLTVLMMMTELLPESFYKIIQEGNYIPLLKKAVPTPDSFHALFKLAFCKNIYTWLLKKVSNSAFFEGKSALPHFLFNLETGRVHEISDHFHHPYRTERHICFYRLPSIGQQHNYFMCYRDNAYVTPVITNESVEFAIKFSKYICMTFIPDSQLGPLLEFYDHTLFRALKEWNENLNAAKLQKTKLHTACSLGKNDIVEALIKSGADINQRDNQGNTPAHYAALNTLALSMIEKLIAHGADVTLPNREGALPASSQTSVNNLLFIARQKIMKARPDALGKDGEPTTDLNFYDPEFAKIALGVKF